MKEIVGMSKPQKQDWDGIISQFLNTHHGIISKP